MFKKLIRDVIKEMNNSDKAILEKKVVELRTEIEELKLKKRLEEEEIKHLVKMKEEKILIETQKKELDLAKQFNTQEMNLQKQYHDKLLKAIEDQRKESKELYSSIMTRLPNVNVEMKR